MRARTCASNQIAAFSEARPREALGDGACRQRGRGAPARVLASTVVAATLAAAGLGGCSTSAPTRYFTLEATAPASASASGTTSASGAASTSTSGAASTSTSGAASTSTSGAVGARTAYTGATLQVRAVHVPPAMDRLEIIDALSPGQVRVRDFDHWAAPLGETARQTLTEDLVARLPRGAVLFPNIAGAGETAVLNADILSFRLSGATAVMEVGWSLQQPAPRPSQAGLATQPGGTASADRLGAQLQLQTPVRGDGAGATALALSDLLGQLADRIAASLMVGGG